MFLFTVAVKSGTNGHHDFDGCDMTLAVIPSSNVPSVGDIITFGNKENRNVKNYLVREVKRMYNQKNDIHEFSEWIYVYVIDA